MVATIVHESRRTVRCWNKCVAFVTLTAVVALTGCAGHYQIVNDGRDRPAQFIGLLVWLDEFLTDPQTPLDRTMGRWDNIVPAAQLIPKGVRGQVTLKAFALAPYDVAPPPNGQPDYGPQVHGQFRGRPYWCPEFWESESPIISGPNCTGGSMALP